MATGRRKQPAPIETDGDAPVAAPPPPSSAKKSPMLPAAIVAVAVLGAAFLLRGGNESPATTASADSTTSTTAAHADPSHVATLEPITLNLADGRFLKVGLALQLAAGTEVEDAAGFGAPALDLAIEQLTGYSSKDLASATGKNEAKDRLSEKLLEIYGGKVTGVYFTQFVMQ